MLKNILHIALRNLLRNKTYNLINLMGLSIGIGCALLVFLFVSNELSYDKCFSDYEYIFRVRSDRYSGGTKDLSAFSSAMVAPTLLQDYPQVAHATRFSKERPSPVYHNGRGFYLTHITRADLDFFEIFDIPFIYGSREEALKRPNTAIITKRTSHKFFDDSNPLGKVIVRDSIPYEITGVIENWPVNSHIQYELILSWDPHEIHDFVRENPWEGSSYNYIKLNHAIDLESFEKRWGTYGLPMQILKRKIRRDIYSIICNP